MTMGAQNIVVEKRTAVRFRSLILDHGDGTAGLRTLIPSFFEGDYFRNYDKTGNKILIRAIKLAYFGNPSSKDESGEDGGVL